MHLAAAGSQAAFHHHSTHSRCTAITGSSSSYSQTQQNLRPGITSPTPVSSLSDCSSRRRATALTMQASPNPSASLTPPVMVNSCTGKMGEAVAEAVLRAGLELVPYTLCAPPPPGAPHTVSISGLEVAMVLPADRDQAITHLLEQYPGLIMVDYTLPSAIHEMVDFYVRHRTPFVMGTTGGDRDKLLAQVRAAGLFAVIAPNMGKQIVAFQAMMDNMATTFPGAFSGYSLKVVESHQSSKKDTSGTAKAVVASFQALGLEFDADQIQLVRDPKQQVEVMKVPEDALQGHAFHTYQLVSSDGSVKFEFQHNVVGRTTYAEGTVDAVLFLARQIQERKSQPKVFNMIDVLKAGDMR